MLSGTHQGSPSLLGSVTGPGVRGCSSGLFHTQANLGTEHSSGSRMGSRGSQQMPDTVGMCWDPPLALLPRCSCKEGRLRSLSAPPGNTGSSSNSAFFFPPLCAAAFLFYPKPFAFLPFPVPVFPVTHPPPPLAAGAGRWTRYVWSGVFWGAWVLRVLGHSVVPLSAVKCSGWSWVTGMGHTMSETPGTDLCGAGHTCSMG